VLASYNFASGYAENKVKKYHEQLLKVYTDGSHPTRMTTELGFNQELVKALGALLQHPTAQRKALLEHIQAPVFGVGPLRHIDNIKYVVLQQPYTAPTFNLPQLKSEYKEISRGDSSPNIQKSLALKIVLENEL